MPTQWRRQIESEVPDSTSKMIQMLILRANTFIPAMKKNEDIIADSDIHSKVVSGQYTFNYYFGEGADDYESNVPTFKGLTCRSLYMTMNSANIARSAEFISTSDAKISKKSESVKALSKIFGFKELTLFQAQALPSFFAEKTWNKDETKVLQKYERVHVKNFLVT